MLIEYRTTLFTRITYIFLALIFQVPIFFIFNAASTFQITLVFLSTIFPALGAFLIYNVFMRKVEMDDASVRYKSVFFKKEIAISDVQGFRITGGKSASLVLVSAITGVDDLSIGNYSEYPDKLMDDIRGRFKDLDGALLEEATKAALNDDHFGANEAERASNLKRAKGIAAAYNFTSFAFCFLLVINNFRWVFLIFLIYPFIGLYLMATNKGLIRFFSNVTKSVVQNLSLGIIISSFILLFSTINRYHVLHFTGVWPLALIVSVVMIALFYACGVNKAVDKISVQLLFMAVAAIPYSIGSVLSLNNALDRTPGQVYQAAVIAHRVSQGRSTSYYITLSPWGPVTDRHETSVDWTLYNAAKVGDSLDVVLHRGWMHLPWYELRQQIINPPQINKEAAPNP